MIITQEVVEKVAALSRLELTEAEIAQQAQHLNAILETMAVLEQIDTEGVAPLAHVLPIQNVLRKDEVQPGLSKDKALANAPEEYDGMFKVPKIV